jgi:hypothetical protein
MNDTELVGQCTHKVVGVGEYIYVIILGLQTVCYRVDMFCSLQATVRNKGTYGKYGDDRDTDKATELLFQIQGTYGKYGDDRDTHKGDRTALPDTW